MNTEEYLLKELSLRENQEYSELFGKDLSEIDPDTDLIIGFEEERQARKIILIPSESICPKAVRQALGSVFTNIYAEGYPPLRMTRGEEKPLLDFEHQLAYYRRYADRRFYKGVDYVHFVETLAQRRAARCFANDKVGADRILVNIQPLSGAAANLAVYEAFLEPGDTLMGMDLLHGGHLTHGSQFNISGKRYNVVSYGISRTTERLDYDAIMDLALEYKPKLIVAGYTSYPWAPDWGKFREIADAVGAVLMADIAHTAGMVIAGVHPNPVGIADVVVFTTHKTLCGPRGAVILTTDEGSARRIDSSVFPGEQGGPHVNKFAAIAVAFKIAQTEKFRRLQERIVENARHLADALQRCGLKLAYGGTDTHLLVIDLRGVKTKTGFPLRGEPAARILDLCGIVTNKNTIPGDEITALGSGIRLGTPWVTQRGMGREEMERLAELMHRVLTNIQPFSYIGLRGELPRGKIDLEILEEVKRGVAELAGRAKAETTSRGSGYPHYYFLPSDPPVKSTSLLVGDPPGGSAALLDLSDMGILEVSGERAKPFLQGVSTNNVAQLRPGQSQHSLLLDKKGQLIDDISILHLAADELGRDRYIVMTNPENTERVKAWFRGLSDGYILFDEDDIFAKIEGPVVVRDLSEDSTDEELRKVAIGLHGPRSLEILKKLNPVLPALEKCHFWEGEINGIGTIVSRTGYTDGFEFLVHPDRAAELWNTLLGAEAKPAGPSPSARNALRSEAGLPLYQCGQPKLDGLSLYKIGGDLLFHLSKPYFVGQKIMESVRPPVKKGEFEYKETEGELRRTPLYHEHLKLTRRIIPFVGWEMPVWYTTTSEEHRAVRETAGLFDVAHMGVLEVAGQHAASFLDTVTTNYVRWLKDGQSHYSYLLDPDGNVIDDIMVYRRAADRYMLVVNAVNAEKDWAWLNAVNSREYLIDRDHPDKEIEGRVTLRDLKDPSSGEDQKIDMALQGPNSLAILQRLTKDEELRAKLSRIRRKEFIETELAGVKLIVARTGYTGEDIGYELYPHPNDAPTLWNLLLETGEEFGIKPAGLGARDSTRIEAGLPLYGQELAGPYNISPMEAGFAPYVKFHKPFFIGRKSLLMKEASRKMEIVRFRMDAKGVRMVKMGDPVVNRSGVCIGTVTSCALDVAGFQIGLAYVDRRYNKEGTEIGIFPLPHGRKIPLGKSKEELAIGDRVLLHNEATVVSRFPIKDPQLSRASR